jgi:hypothetical protein
MATTHQLRAPSIEGPSGRTGTSLEPPLFESRRRLRSLPSRLALGNAFLVLLSPAVRRLGHSEQAAMIPARRPRRLQSLRADCDPTTASTHVALPSLRERPLGLPPLDQVERERLCHQRAARAYRSSDYILEIIGVPPQPGLNDLRREHEGRSTKSGGYRPDPPMVAKTWRSISAKTLRATAKKPPALAPN